MKLPLLFTLLLLSASLAHATSASPAQTHEHLTVAGGRTYGYLLALPEGFDADPAKPWPLVVFLHGVSQRGIDLTQVHQYGPPLAVDGGRKFPFVLVSPQCPEGEYWNLPGLEAFITEVAAKYRADPDRIYLTGLSMGGFGVWGLAQRQPERYAAIAPICGGGDPKLAARLRDLPVWAFHGGLDHVVPVARTKEMIAAIEAAGGHPRMTIYPELKHVSWTEPYAGEELYAWLLAQRRPAHVPGEALNRLNAPDSVAADRAPSVGE